MCFLFRCSKYISVPILLDWLDLHCINNLDIALCNHQSRDVLLGIMSEFSDKFKSVLFKSVNIPLTLGALRWFNAKEMSIPETLTLSDNTIVQLQSKLSVIHSIWSLMGGHHKAAVSEKKLLISCLDKVKHVTIAKCCNHSLKNLLKFFGYFKTIEYLEFGPRSSIADRKATLLTIACSNNTLRVLDLSGYYMQSEKHLFPVCRQSPNLESLTVNIYLEINNLLLTLIIHCRKLNSLTLKNKKQDDKLLILIMHGYTPFKNIAINHITRTALQSLVWFRGSQLQSLELRFYEDCHKCTLNDLPLVSKQLKKLRVEGSTKQEEIQCIGKLTNLNEIHLIGAANNAIDIIQLLQQQTNVVTLDIVGTRITFTFATLSYNKQHRKYWSNLRTVSMTHCHLESPDAFMIVSLCPLLEEVDFSGNNKLTDQVTVGLTTLPHLRKLNLGYCIFITDYSLSLLSEQCRELSELYLEGCIGLTPAGLCLILQNGNIVRLDTSRCELFNSSVVQCIEQFGCHKLEYFNICSTEVKYEDLRQLILCCKRLKVLVYRFQCLKVDETSNIKKIVASYPNLELIGSYSKSHWDYW